MRHFGIAALLVALPALSMAAPTVQTRPWRVAIAGGQAVAARGGDIPGYLSLVALHGLPRVRLDDVELTDLKRLRQFDVIIACWSNFGSEAAMRTLERYAQEGGIVLSEGWPMPSADVIPGKRIGPAPSANMCFVPSSHPLSQGLPELGVIKCGARYRESGSIIPDPGSRAIVLARYTDEGAPKETQGRFRDGDQGAPAVLLTPYGEGMILYYGPAVSPDLSPAGQPPYHFICRFLEWVSNGELTGRVYTGKMGREEFVTEAPAPDDVTAYPEPPGPAQPAPEGFEVLDDAEQLQDFCLAGGLAAGGETRVLVAYWSDRDQTELAFGAGKLTVRNLRTGMAQSSRTVSLPQRATQVVVSRRDGLLTVTADGALVYQGCPGPPQQGVLAVQGLQDPLYQTLAPVYFTDGFMRDDKEVTGEWETQGADWHVVTSEGKAETAVNPFNYQVTTDRDALSLTGAWFWSDLSCSVSARGDGGAIGVIADYADKDDYVLLKLVLASDPRSSCLQLVQHRAGGDEVLTEATVTAARGDWHDLELRTSRGRLQGWLNGEFVLAAQGSPAACGRVGLYCQQGGASFDDVEVESWVASPPSEAFQLETTVAAGGVWNCVEPDGTILGQGADGARLLLPWPAVSDCSAGVKVRLDQSEAAGLLLHSKQGEGTLVVLRRSGDGLRLEACHQRRPETLLLATPVPGSPAEWHRLHARYAGRRLEIAVDGKPLGEALDVVTTGGAAGLYAQGAQPAQFQDFRAWAEPGNDHLADEPTPEFAGVIDRNTWAGRSGAWTPDPAHLDRLWHAGYFPRSMHVVAGIHPLGATQTTTTLLLARPDQPDTGYALQAHHIWAEPTVALELSRAGETVARATAPVAAGTPYGLGLQRCGADVLATVDGKSALAWHDAQARPELCALGVDNGGQLLVADDIVVASPDVHNYTFEVAPTDWAVESGTWKLSSRWSCSPGWSWFCGENADGPALAATRQAYVGDMDAVSYFSAKMIKRGGRVVEDLADVHFGCCADDARADSGYHFIVGAEGNKRTVMLRNGQEVASSPYRIAQGLIHNDWLRLTIRRRGPQVTLWIWDTPILSWADPQPLPAGRVTVGTMRNGVVVPRVTIYGQQAASGSDVKMAPARPLPRPLLMFEKDSAQAEFGGDWGLWPQYEGCRGTATFVPGQDAEGKGGGATKVEYTIKAPPRSFSLYVNSARGGVNLRPHDRFVLYARGDVPSLTLVVKDTSSADPDAPQGIAEFVLKGLTDQWQRFEAPFADFLPRAGGARINWRAINHIGIAMIAPQNADGGTFWVDNLRAEAQP